MRELIYSTGEELQRDEVEARKMIEEQIESARLGIRGYETLQI